MKTVSDTDILRILRSTLDVASRRGLVTLLPVDDSDTYSILGATIADGQVQAIFGLLDADDHKATITQPPATAGRRHRHPGMRKTQPALTAEGAALRSIRAACQMTQQEFSRALGLPTSTYSRIEAGTRDGVATLVAARAYYDARKTVS